MKTITIELSAASYDELATELNRHGQLLEQNSPVLTIGKKISITRSQAECLDAETIVNLVCQEFKELNVGPPDVWSQSRKWPIIRCRHTAMALLRNVCRRGLSEIGREFNRDHSITQWACDAIANLRSTNPTYNAQYEALEAKVKALKV